MTAFCRPRLRPTEIAAILLSGAQGENLLINFCLNPLDR
jgi:hypothetical protein